MKYYIACPARHATGGIELLHQLVHELNTHVDVEAKIWYFNYKGSVDNLTPQQYEIYNNEYVLDSVPEENSVLIFPEIWASCVWEDRFRNHKKVIYWESVDNYFYHVSPVNRSQFRFPTDVLHMVQSRYASTFLTNCCGVSENLIYVSDYINPSFKDSNSDRSDVILFNPAKADIFTHILIDYGQDKYGLIFRPIHNLTQQEVIDLMCHSKVYVDFGNHPGKDRLPREAAMCGCCVVVGRKGSVNYGDVLIPEQFKFEREYPNIAVIAQTLRLMVDNYAMFTGYYDIYRALIKREHSEFKSGVNALVKRYEV